MMRWFLRAAATGEMARTERVLHRRQRQRIGGQ